MDDSNDYLKYDESKQSYGYMPEKHSEAITKYKAKLLDLYGIDLFSTDGKLLVGAYIIRDVNTMKLEILKRYLYCRGVDVDNFVGCEVKIKEYHKYLQSISILRKRDKMPKLKLEILT